MSAIKQPVLSRRAATSSHLPHTGASTPHSGAPRLAAPVARTWRAEPRPRIFRSRLSRGQSTVEYALLVVGIATVALLVLAWASSTDVVGALFDRVFRWVTGRVG